MGSETQFRKYIFHTQGLAGFGMECSLLKYLITNIYNKMEEHSEFVLFRDIGYRLIICLSELVTRCKKIY